MTNTTIDSVERLRGVGYGVVEDGAAVIVVASKLRQTRAVRFGTPQIAARKLVDRRHLCSQCAAEVTEADREAGKCTQCFEPILRPIS